MDLPVAVLLGAAAALIVILLVVAFWRWRSRRATIRRLVVIKARLVDDDVELGGRGRLDRHLSDLERATEAVTRLGERRLARERMQGALNAIAEGVVVCDEDGQIVLSNDPATTVLDDTGADTAAWQAMTDLLKSSVGGQRQRQTIELYGPPRRSLDVVAVPLDDGWRATGAVVVIEDLTARRRVESMRRDFLANVAHELSQPVGGLALLAEALVAEEDPQVADRLSSRLQAEARMVARVVTDLVELSRVESEEAPEREPVLVHAVVAQAVDRVRALADRRSIEIAVGDVSRHVAVVGERRQLVSALYNLLENAVRYSDEHSSVEVAVGADGEWVTLVVRDRGIGIAPGDLERVFERFYRVDPSRRRDTGGSGLGLAIVRHIAGSHGGEVRAESQEGEGSTFTLRLPAGPGPVA